MFVYLVMCTIINYFFWRGSQISPSWFLCESSPDRIGIWNVVFLEKRESRRTRIITKKTQHLAPGWNWTRATLVGGEHSQHCAILSLFSVVRATRHSYIALALAFVPTEFKAKERLLAVYQCSPRKKNLFWRSVFVQTASAIHKLCVTIYIVVDKNVQQTHPCNKTPNTWSTNHFLTLPLSRRRWMWRIGMW